MKGCLALCSAGHLSELSFAFERTATFNFNIDGKVFSSSLVLRLRQRHRGGQNNWWVGNEQGFRADTQHGSGVVCGRLLFREADSNEQSNSCLRESGSSHDSTHDNQLYLDSRGGQSFFFSFDPSWYAVTVGQPVAASCWGIQGGTLTFSAGRQHSKEAAFVFMKGNSENSIIHTMLSESNLAVASLPNLVDGSGTQSELNFALEGNATFAFEDNDGRAFSGSMVLRVGQGRQKIGSNNWWLGAPGCYQKSCINCFKCDCTAGRPWCGPPDPLRKAACIPYGSYLSLFPHVVKFLANTTQFNTTCKDYDSINQHSHQSTPTTRPQGGVGGKP